MVMLGGIQATIVLLKWELRKTRPNSTNQSDSI